MEPGWTFDDLVGELWAMGIDIDEISDSEIRRVLQHELVERAAEEISRRLA